MLEMTSELVGEVTAEVFGATAFVMVEPASGAGGEGGELAFCVDFGGPAPGRVWLEAPLGLGQEILENLFDGSGAPGESDALDALREMTNVIAGALLPRVFGDVYVTLGIPHGPEAQGASSEEAQPSRFRAELITDTGHHLAVTFAWSMS